MRGALQNRRRKSECAGARDLGIGRGVSRCRAASSQKPGECAGSANWSSVVWATPKTEGYCWRPAEPRAAPGGASIGLADLATAVKAGIAPFTLQPAPSSSSEVAGPQRAMRAASQPSFVRGQLRARVCRRAAPALMPTLKMIRHTCAYRDRRGKWSSVTGRLCKDLFAAGDRADRQRALGGMVRKPPRPIEATRPAPKSKSRFGKNRPVFGAGR